MNEMEAREREMERERMKVTDNLAKTMKVE
jgi:hypothetical protein